MLRRLPTIVLAALASFAPLTLAAAERPLTVVELFTSQGCSSCPPADAFLGELAGRDDVLALSVHVDYWDYIGWKDPFASPDHTRRQRDYARNFRLRYVYTPQMVVQGRFQAVGSDRDAVLEQIDQARPAKRIPVAIRRDDKGVSVSIPGAHTQDEAAVLLAVYDRRHDTPIKRGENAGKTLAYHNVVRQIMRVGTWRGGAMEIPMALDVMATQGRDGCAVILQSLATGHIIGAARLDLGVD